MKEGIANGIIPSTVADSAATSGVGTIDDPCRRTGQPSHKQFILPDGTVIPATEIAEYPFEVRKLARVLLVTPGVSQNSLLSTVKFADANYITIFDKDEVNIYDANDTTITVAKGAILRGWRDDRTNLWRIPLVRMVRNLNTDTALLNRPPSEFLLNRPSPTEAIHSVYELKIRVWYVRNGWAMRQVPFLALVVLQTLGRLQRHTHLGRMIEFSSDQQPFEGRLRRNS